MAYKTLGSIPADQWFTRESLAEVLSACGFPISKRTLATKATRGGGPPYAKFGNRALYQGGPAVNWATAILSAPAANSSEHRLTARRRDYGAEAPAA
jgi:hypothetical protein